MIAAQTDYREDYAALLADEPLVGIVDPQVGRSGNTEWIKGRARPYTALTIVLDTDDHDLAREILTDLGFTVRRTV